MTDELSAPLGQSRRAKRRVVLPRAVPIGLAGLLAASVLGFIGWIAVADDPLGGEPVAVVSTTPAKPPAAQGAQGQSAGPAPVRTAAVAEPPPANPAAPAPAQQTVTVIDGSSGKRQQVAVAPSEPAQPVPVDERLVEPSRHGPIPKVGADGARPSEVYAGRKQAAAARGGPRIAIVVSQLGVSASATSEAFAKLPGAVTFGFMPYGTDLERWAARARGEGHEIMLQVPMEPFDYPDNDPGPQTLLIAQSAEQNTDRLHWSMSRFQGYVGLANLMGARLVSNEQALTPLMREAGKRGLIYFDDGLVPRSVAGQVATGNNVPFAKADLVIDAKPAAGEIDAALARLEKLARERGIAVGSASALPMSIDRIAKWAKAAEARGVVLVPITAVANKPKSS